MTVIMSPSFFKGKARGSFSDGSRVQPVGDKEPESSSEDDSSWLISQMDMVEAQSAMNAIIARHEKWQVSPSTESSSSSDKRDNYTEALEKRREARRASMKARQSLTDQQKKDDESIVSRPCFSEEERRTRAYKFYCILGKISRKELKKRVKTLGERTSVAEEDIDLLPWNFNGSIVNVAKLHKLGIKD